MFHDSYGMTGGIVLHGYWMHNERYIGWSGELYMPSWENQFVFIL